MAGAEVLVFSLVAVAVLAAVALRHDVPYPIVLVVGGLALGFVPALPAPELEPDLVFFAFLPPLLYAAAFQASAYELRANAGPDRRCCSCPSGCSSATSSTGSPTRSWWRWPRTRCSSPPSCSSPSCCPGSRSRR